MPHNQDRRIRRPGRDAITRTPPEESDPEAPVSWDGEEEDNDNLVKRLQERLEQEDSDQEQDNAGPRERRSRRDQGSVGDGS